MAPHSGREPLAGPFFEQDEAGPGAAVTGIPFSATTVTEMTQTLADGNHIVHRVEGTIARDSAGRVRREHTLTGLGPVPMAPEGGGHRFITIEDPTAGARYVLNPEQKTARKTPFLFKRRRPDGDAGNRRERFGDQAPAPVRESLGTRTIDGIDAEGTRTTMTIPAGQIGNELPIRTAMERWYAPSVQAVIESKFSDPRFGERTFRLTSIHREEPPADLFQVPSDYTLVQGRGPAGRRQPEPR
jgi:hypothetical protein